MSNSPGPFNRNPLGFDDAIGILIAFGTIGTILGWALLQSGRPGGFFDRPLVSGLPAASPQATPQSEFPLGGTRQRTASPYPQTSGQRQDPRAVPSPGLTVVPGAAGAVGAAPALVPVPGVILPVPTVSPSPVTQASPSPGVGVAPTTSPTASPIAAVFTDIPQGYWATPFIAALSQRQALVGYRDRTYRPDRPVTRAEFATIIQKGFQRQNTQELINYTDVADDYWAADSIKSSTRDGFIEGFPDRTYKPNEPVTRLQVYLALVSGLGLQPSSDPQQSLNRFEDGGEVPEYAVPAISAATQSGIVVNHPEREILNPSQNATRAEVAAIVYQALVEAGQAEPIQSEYVVNASPSPSPSLSPSPSP